MATNVSWVVWLGLAVVVIALVAALRGGAARRRKREEAERLAIAADARHEGARTRHEGGA